MKGCSVKLERNTILELYGRLFQLVLGLAGTSEFNWSAFQRYYNPDRVAEVQHIMERVRRLLPAGAASSIATVPRPARLAPEDQYSLTFRLFCVLAGPFMVYIWPLFNGRKTSWSFPCEELTYMLGRLQAFLDLLQVPGHPGYERVVPLRMELNDCCWLILSRCDGVRELEQIHLVEYFNMAPHAKPIPLSAIVKREAPSAA